MSIFFVAHPSNTWRGSWIYRGIGVARILNATADRSGTRISRGMTYSFMSNGRVLLSSSTEVTTSTIESIRR